jgi:hypothetical protein
MPNIFPHGTAAQGTGPCGAPPCSPKAAALEPHLQRDASAAFQEAWGGATEAEADSPALSSGYLRARRAPIADATLNFRMVHEAVEILKESGWSYESGNRYESSPQVADLHQELVSKDLFRRMKQAPLSLVQLPRASAPTTFSFQRLPHAETVQPPLSDRSHGSAVTAIIPPVPSVKNSHLFAAAVSPRNPRPRHESGVAVEEYVICGSDRSKRIHSGRKTAGSFMPVSARVPAEGAAHSSASLVACTSVHQPHPPEQLPTVSISQFDFRSTF